MSIVVNIGGELTDDRIERLGASRTTGTRSGGAPPVGLHEVAQETTVIEVSVDKLWSTRRRYLYKNSKTFEALVSFEFER